MAKCPKCNASLEADDEFCPECGARVVKEAKPLKELKEPASKHLPISFRIMMYIVLLFLFALMLRLCAPFFASGGMMPNVGIVFVMVVAVIVVVSILLKLEKKRQ
ncbi:MAG: zinc-ribbon domain-containing protein [Nanoarchaeota archaeon]|nr:zinc-ribbon domain-containing protein [Nanoarchaeota archaeon]